MREGELIQVIDQQKLPRHIAIIMDGNGRWAKKRGLPRAIGHRAGMEALKEVVRICCDLKIEVLTVFGFSTENWKRPREEIAAIMNLLVEYLTREIEELSDKNVQVNPIGRLLDLPPQAQETLARAVNRTCTNNGLILNLALNYGGRAELTDAVRTIASAVEAEELKSKQIDDRTLADHLYTAGQPDPDLLIRPSGEFRISNFLLWQLAYAEIWFTDKLWPDFSRVDLLEALGDYQHRERRFGGLKSSDHRTCFERGEPNN